jgi:hypothetical protein
MPSKWKLTGKPKGRPPKDLEASPYVVVDRDGSLVVDPDGRPAFRPTVPEWWIAMVEMEVRLKGSGTWNDYGSLKQLAAHFGDKRPAAVTKARRDPRYVAMVNHLL